MGDRVTMATIDMGLKEGCAPFITSRWDDRCKPRRLLYPRNKCLSYEFIIRKIANILHYGYRCHGDLLCSHTIYPDLLTCTCTCGCRARSSARTVVAPLSIQVILERVDCTSWRWPRCQIICSSDAQLFGWKSFFEAPVDFLWFPAYDSIRACPQCSAQYSVWTPWCERFLTIF